MPAQDDQVLLKARKHQQKQHKKMYKHYMKAQTLSGAGIDFLHEQSEKHRIPATQFRQL